MTAHIMLTGVALDTDGDGEWMDAVTRMDAETALAVYQDLGGTNASGLTSDALHVDSDDEKADLMHEQLLGECSSPLDQRCRPCPSLVASCTPL